MLSTRSSFCLPGDLLRAWRPRPRSRNKSRGLTGSWAFSLLILAAGAYVTQIFLAATHVAVMVSGIVAYLCFRILNAGLEGYVLPRACLLAEKDGCTNLVASEMPKASCRPQPRDACKEPPKEEVKQLGRGAAIVVAAPKANHPRATAKKMGRKVRRSAEQQRAAAEQPCAAAELAAQQEVPSGAESTTASEKEDATGAVESSKQERSIAATQTSVSDKEDAAETPDSLKQRRTIAAKLEASTDVPSRPPSVPVTKKADAAPAAGDFSKKERTNTPKQVAVVEVPLGASSTTSSEKDGTPEQSGAIITKHEPSAEVPSVPPPKKVNVAAAPDSSKKERTTTRKHAALAEVPAGVSSTTASEKEDAAETLDPLKQRQTITRKQAASAEVAFGAPSAPATKKVAASDSLKQRRTIASKQVALAEVPSGVSSPTSSEKESATETRDSSKDSMTITSKQEVPAEIPSRAPSLPVAKKAEAAAASVSLKEEQTTASKQLEVPEVPAAASSTTSSEQEGAAARPDSFKQSETIITKPEAQVEVPSDASSTTASEKEEEDVAAQTPEPLKECSMTPPVQSAPMPKEEPEVNWDKVVESIILREASSGQHKSSPTPRPQGRIASLPPPPEEVPPPPTTIAAVDDGTADEDGKEDAPACATDAPVSLGKLDPGPDLPPGLAIPPRAAAVAFVGPPLAAGTDPPAPPGLPPPPLLMAKPAVAEELASANENAVEQDETSEDGAKEGGNSESSESLLPHVGRVLQAAANGQLYVEKVEGDHPLLKLSGRGLTADAAPFNPAAAPREETWDGLEGHDEWQQMEVAAMWQQWWAEAAAGYDGPGVQLCEGFDGSACSFPAGFPGCHPAMEGPNMCDPDASYIGMCDPAVWGDAYECSNEYWNSQAAQGGEEEHLAY